MKSAIIVHGWPSKEEYFDPTQPSPSHNHWLPWMRQHLVTQGIVAYTPEMPDAWRPSYEKWSTTFEQYTVDEHTVLIGHSCGAGFLLRWLSEHPVTVGAVYLIAPWIDPEHSERESIGDFF